MPSSFLITRPDYDVVTSYLCVWGQRVLAEADQNGKEYIDLVSERANNREFTSRLKKLPDIKLVLLNGHGSDSAVAGHQEEILVDTDNSHLLKGKTVHAFSCNSSAVLGKDAVKKGCKAYIGYSYPFGFLTDKNKSCTPEEDELAGIFKEAPLLVSTSLVKGNKPKEAFEKGQGKYRELLLKYATSTEPDAESVRYWLFWNMNAHSIEGA